MSSPPRSGVSESVCIQNIHSAQPTPHPRHVQGAYQVPAVLGLGDEVRGTAVTAALLSAGRK